MYPQLSSADHPDYPPRVPQPQQQERDHHASREPWPRRMPYASLPSPRPIQKCRIAQTSPHTASLPESPRPAQHRSTENVLVRGVITDHPLPPERRRSVQVEHRPPPALRRLNRASRRGVERNPPVAREVGFYPGMRILCPNHVIAGYIVEFIAAEPVHHS